MEISRDGGRSQIHTSPRYRLFAREGLIPYFRRGAHTRTDAHTDTVPTDTVDVYLHGASLFFII